MSFKGKTSVLSGMFFEPMATFNCSIAFGDISVGQRICVLLRDWDGIFGYDFVEQFEAMGIKEVLCLRVCVCGTVPASSTSVPSSKPFVYRCYMAPIR